MVVLSCNECFFSNISYFLSFFSNLCVCFCVSVSFFFVFKYYFQGALVRTEVYFFLVMSVS